MPEQSCESQARREPSAQALRECLFRVGRVSAQTGDLEQLLLAIIQECATLLDCEAASVAIYNAASDDLAFAVASGEVERSVRQIRMKMGEGVVGRVAVVQQPYFTNDPARDSFWSGKVDKTSAFQTRNLAAVPMVRQGLLIGVLEAINCRTEAGFQPQDLDLLQLFADQVAIAIENHRLIIAREESERLATFAVALADIGHSIKNILMRLEFPIKMIERGITDQRWEMLGANWPVMARAATDIGSLVREMLDYSKRSELSRTSLDVAALAREVVEQCRPDAQSKKIELHLVGADEALMWLVDQNSLRYALHNLVGNAIEAIAEHGGSAVTVTLGIETGDAILKLLVADDGPGIPPEIQKRIFDPFFTTKKAKGTGLGLANVKKGVEAHGGSVRLRSEPGKGTTFILCYPQSFQD